MPMTVCELVVKGVLEVVRGNTEVVVNAYICMLGNAEQACEGEGESDLWKLGGRVGGARG